MASWSFRSTKASWLLRNLRPKRLEEPMASWSFRSTKASWLLSSLKEPMASWRFFCKRSTKASWLPEAETSRGAHGILDPKPFKAFNVRQTFSKNFQKLDPVLHALCGRCHCRWTSTHICTRIWGAVIGARAGSGGAAASGGGFCPCFCHHSRLFCPLLPRFFSCFFSQFFRVFHPAYVHWFWELHLPWYSWQVGLRQQPP